MHRVRPRRQLAIVRELWNARDELARAQDVSPGRIIPDSSIVEAALAQPGNRRALTAMTTFTGRGSRRYADVWADAVRRALELPESELPPQHLPTEGPPPARVWVDRDPVAAARLARTRAVVAAVAAEHTLPVENLLSPDIVRRLCWAPPDPADEPAVRAFLAERGARSWQVDLTAAALAAALADSSPTPITIKESGDDQGRRAGRRG
jgi:ribonuclease D